MAEMLTSIGLIIYEEKQPQMEKYMIMLEMQICSMPKLQQLQTVTTFLLFLCAMPQFPIAQLTI